ncbi:hypothetical protein WICPIJ_003489, partial [Wickerhamomyces pijperi]
NCLSPIQAVYSKLSSSLRIESPSELSSPSSSRELLSESLVRREDCMLNLFWKSNRFFSGNKLKALSAANAIAALEFFLRNPERIPPLVPLGNFASSLIAVK